MHYESNVNCIFLFLDIVKLMRSIDIANERNVVNAVEHATLNVHLLNSKKPQISKF